MSSILLPGDVNQVLDRVGAKSTEQLKREAIEAIEQGTELDDEQLSQFSVSDAREIALEAERKQREAIEAQEAEQAEVAEADGFIATRTVDLRDGSGVQVFTGKSSVSQIDALNDLADKLAEAQRNATLRIKKFATDERQQREDAEYINSKQREEVENRLRANPAAEIARIARETLEAEQAKLNRGAQAQQDFVASHPTYVPVPENGQAMVQWIQSHGYDEFTAENLELAWRELTKAGKLMTKGNASTPNKSAARSSSISTSRSSAPHVPTELDEAALYAMDLTKLKALANEQMAKNAADRDDWRS